MHGVQVRPTEQDVEDSKSSNLSEDDKRKEVSVFSWPMAINYFDGKTRERLGKAGMYFMDDGTQITDENFLTCVTAEICREFGFELLNVMADLMLPVGFGYPPLTNNLQAVVDDAFKLKCITGQRKTIVWVEDEYWNNPSYSIVEPIVMQLLLEKTEPFLIAPMKYFDKEVLSTVFKVLDPHTDAEVGDSGTCWETFSALIKFGFLLALRSSAFPIIILHFSQKMTEMVDAFQLVDLAVGEGHMIKYFKNTASTFNRETTIKNFVDKLIFPGSVN